jgi:hypothetical protein
LKSFSPALADTIGLRRVKWQNEINPEGIIPAVVSGVNPHLGPFLRSFPAPCQKVAQGIVALATLKLYRMKGKCRCLIKLLLQDVQKLAAGFLERPFLASKREQQCAV